MAVPSLGAFLKPRPNPHCPFAPSLQSSTHHPSVVYVALNGIGDEYEAASPQVLGLREDLHLLQRIDGSPVSTNDLWGAVQI
jgi:hypothetical protein